MAKRRPPATKGKNAPPRVAARRLTPKGEATLALFSYPTPMIARQQLAEFEKIPGAAAKRTAALVAIAFAPDQTAHALLSQINYHACLLRHLACPLHKVSVRPEIFLDSKGHRRRHPK